ncbi:MAG: hypothetical protein J1F64_11470 [Oscillospiraceae bacterium]|nr:hypothetical protein [Oscillospiraceae bacterium]
MRIFRRISAFILSAAIVISMGMTVSAKELVTIDGLRYVSDNGENTLYTGWTTINGLHRYYKEGKRCIGWHKINGSYYYLTRYGGKAWGLYQIGDTVYEFGENGKYIGKASSDTTTDAIIQAAIDRMNNFAFKGTTYEKYEVYADDVTFTSLICFLSDGDEGDTYAIYLTSHKNFDIYKDLWGDCAIFEYKKAKASYNDLIDLKQYIISDKKEIQDKLNIRIVSFDIWYDYLDITVEHCENEEVEQFRNYLIEKGVSGDMFGIAVIIEDTDEDLWVDICEFE